MEEKKPVWTARLALATLLDTLIVIAVGGYVIATSSIGLTKTEIPLRAGLGFMVFAGGLAYFLIPNWFLGATLWQWILGAKKREGKKAEAAVSEFHSGSAFGRRLTIMSNKPGYKRTVLLTGFLFLAAVFAQISMPIEGTDAAYRVVILCCLLAGGIVQIREVGTVRISRSNDRANGSHFIGNLAVLYLVSLAAAFVISAWIILRLFFAK